MADDGLVDRLEGALLALRSLTVRHQAECLAGMLPELGWMPLPRAPIAGDDLAVFRAGDFTEVRLRQGTEQLDVLERIQGPLARRAADVAREVDVESFLEAFVAGVAGSSSPAILGYRLKPRRLLLEVRGEDAPRELWGWSFEDADGKGADCRLFCDDSGSRRWTWFPGSPGDDPQLHAYGQFRCHTCGLTPHEHLLVPSGMSACSLTEGGHLAGDLCECTPLPGDLDALSAHDLDMPHGFDLAGNISDCPPNCSVELARAGRLEAPSS